MFKPYYTQIEQGIEQQDDALTAINEYRAMVDRLADVEAQIEDLRSGRPPLTSMWSGWRYCFATMQIISGGLTWAELCLSQGFNASLVIIQTGCWKRLGFLRKTLKLLWRIIRRSFQPSGTRPKTEM